MPFAKWKDFEDCVRDFISQGKDEESAKRICGYIQARLGKESFSWVGTIESHEKNLIRGKALHPIKTIHPEEWPGVRVYLEEELEKAAHTLAGTPLLLDHLYPIDGRVLGAEYEDGAVEYIAELADKRVLNLIRDGTIKHCSVEYDWSSLDKVNGVAPKGIRFTGLALLKNSEPGDPASSVEMWRRIAEALKESKSLSSPNAPESEAGEEKQIQEKTEQQKADQAEEGDLEGEIEVLRQQIEALKEEKAKLVKQLGEAVIEPSVKEEDFRGMVLEELKEAVFERVPRHWGYGPYEQNRRIKGLIRRLEGKE